jgi:biotin operon repressor
MNQIHKMKGGDKINDIHCLVSSSYFNFPTNKMNQTHKMKRKNKMKEIKDMNKTELTELAINQMNEIQELKEAHEASVSLIAELQSKLEATSKDGRKSQVLELLRKHETISILEMSKLLGISTKNVSSQLTYLRSDGYAIFTDPNGRKMLVESKKTESDSENQEESTE